MRRVAWLVALALLGLPAQAPAQSPRAREAATTYIFCLTSTGSYYQARYRPAACAHFGPGGSFGGGVNLNLVRWRTWGGAVARGSGRERGFHLPYSSIPVSLTAYAPATGCGGRRVYTRLRATSRFGTTVVALRRCPGRA